MRKLVSISMLFFCSFCVTASEKEQTNQQPLWHVHVPEGGVKKQTGPIQVVNIRLLTQESVIAKNLKTEELVEFLKHLESAVKGSYEPGEEGELLVRIELVKDSLFGFKFQYKGDLTSSFLQRVSDNIGKLENLSPVNDSVSFQVHYTIGAAGA